jgi:hypothetical protein
MINSLLGNVLQEHKTNNVFLPFNRSFIVNHEIMVLCLALSELAGKGGGITKTNYAKVQLKGGGEGHKVA